MSTPSEVANLLLESESAIVLTGAGLSVSAPANIPLFRGTGGLWLDPDNRRWASRESFDEDVDWWYGKFWDFYERQIAAAPTAGHLALRDMVNANVIDSIQTQNIDGLDRLAGTPESRVFELHGHDRSFTCTGSDCDYNVTTEDLLLGQEREGVPYCPCHKEERRQPLKPDVLLFDDYDIPPALGRAHEKAFLAEQAADTLLVVGTSLAIEQINNMVVAFTLLGRNVAVINPEPTPTDERAQLLVQATADEALTEIRDLVIA